MSRPSWYSKNELLFLIATATQSSRSALRFVSDDDIFDFVCFNAHAGHTQDENNKSAIHLKRLAKIEVVCECDGVQAN